ncbi:MAG: MFS transporter [Promethearchaeia archaeon]
MDQNQQKEKGKFNKRYPLRIIASYELGMLIWMMMNQIFVQQTQYYYQNVIGLGAGLIALAFIIYTIFNMFNDPIIGHFSDKSTRFREKWGKRFPFIMMGIIPFSFTLIFIFGAPKVSQVGPLAVFFWLLFFICMYDLFFSIFDVNHGALFPEKFRNDKDRKLAGMVDTILETIGILLGIVVPIIIIDSVGGWLGYFIQGIIISIVCFVFALLMIPGVKEDPEVKERYAEKETQESIEFFTGMKSAIKDKNLIGFMCLYTAYATTMGILIASVPYFVDDILHLPKTGELVLIAYLVAVPITAGIWYKLSFKIGIKNVTLIGAIILSSMGLPLLFVPADPSGLALFLIVLFLAGLVDGAIISMKFPVFSSIVDVATIESEKHEEGLYKGIFTFFQRLGITIRVVIFWIVQALSGYDPTTPNTSAELCGLRIQVSIIPMIIMFFGIVIFWRFYQISRSDLEKNLEELDKMGL